MGNYKFRLSDMVPNAWFYKLRKMGKGRKQTTTPSNKKNKNQSSSSASKPNQPHQCNPRKSYYFTRELLNPNNNKFYTNNSPEQPRKPSKHRTRRRRTPTARTSSSSVSAGCSCRTTVESVWTKSDSPPEHSSSPFYSSTESESPADPEFRTDRVLIPTESFDQMVSCACKLPSNTTTTTDIVIDVDKNSLARKDDKLERYEYVDAFSELELPPIITKPPNPKKKEDNSNKEGSLKIKFLKEDNNKAASMKQQQQQQQRSGHVRRILPSHSVNSPGVKLRVNSPRIASRKVQCHGRKSVPSTAISGNRRSLSDSLAIVKSSFNPQKDFRESMVEMIVENNIRASKDLEDLLACYLSLNSDEYHDLIIKVFKQIWFDLTRPT